MSINHLTLRGVRGATTVPENDAGAISAATEALLREMLLANDLAVDDLISIIFTMTPDLDAAFPAAAARHMGLGAVPLLCATEIDVPEALPRCIRVLMHVATPLSPSELQHVYLGGARGLRSDLYEA